MTLEQSVRLLISVVILGGVGLLAKYEIDNNTQASQTAYWIFAAAALGMIFKISGEDIVKLIDDFLKKRK